VLGSIGTALYRGQIADTVPQGIPPDTAEAARDTLGGAVAAAGRLGDPRAGELLDAAREAFTRGVQVAAIVSPILAIATAIVAAISLREARAGGEPEGEAEGAVDGAAAAGTGAWPIEQADSRARSRGSR